jgi:hypothetical protein
MKLWPYLECVWVWVSVRERDTREGLVKVEIDFYLLLLLIEIASFHSLRGSQHAPNLSPPFLDIHY